MVKLSALLILVTASLVVAARSFPPFSSDPPKVLFDLPLTAECRDVSPRDFGDAHPTLKVVEAKFRISARFVAGSESDIADFLYIIASPDKKMRFQDYLPNTTLESAVADDQIEIIDTTENAKGGEMGAKVGYQGAGGGLSMSKASKKTHSNHYKEIAPRALVVASGTTDHEHGIFFKLKPSRAASLEGAKAFTFLVVVPKSWRAGWCTVSCGARTNHKTILFGSELVPAGVAQSQVGLYLMGDADANSLADELAKVQQRHAQVLAGQLAKGALLEEMYATTTSGNTASLCGIFKSKPAHWESASERKELENARRAVLDVQERLGLLSE